MSILFMARQVLNYQHKLRNYQQIINHEGSKQQ